MSQQVLNSGTGRNQVLNTCAHELWLFAATYSCRVNIIHKPLKDLLLADALSSRSFDRAAKMKATEIYTEVPLSEITVEFNQVFTPDI